MGTNGYGSRSARDTQARARGAPRPPALGVLGLQREGRPRHRREGPQGQGRALAPAWRRAAIPGPSRRPTTRQEQD